MSSSIGSDHTPYSLCPVDVPALVVAGSRLTDDMDTTLARMLSIKRKKFVFNVSLKLELTNLPIVTGIIYCKVRLFDGGFQAFSSR